MARDPDRPPEPFPPWIWFWLVIYLVTLPQQMALWRPIVARAAGFGLGRPDSLINAAAVLEGVPLLAVLLGVAAVFVPRLRAVWLERRFGLTDPAPLPTVLEIQTFVARHAPGLRVRANLLRTDQLAFVYPLTYRKAALAIFGGIVTLWGTDPAAARAVLLHEIAHYRHGDVLAVGAGNLLGTLTARWLVLYLALVVIPLVVVGLIDRVTAVRSLLALNAAGVPFSPFEIGIHLTRQVVGTTLPAVMLIGAALMLWTASVIVLPLAAIWSAELNADRYAADAGGAADLDRALAALPAAGSTRQWLLSRMSHPPIRLRRFAAALAARGRGALLLLLLLPVAYVVRLALLVCWALAAFPLLGGAIDLGTWLQGNVRGYVAAIGRVWLPMAAFLLLWPRLAPHWQRVWLPADVATRPSLAGACVAAAVAVGVLGLAGVVADGTIAAHLRRQPATAAIPAWQRGDRVEVEWRGKWWKATILDVADGRVLVHYEGFGRSWDEWVPPSRIRKPD
ncbi:MAG: M48 family metalloprotease [Armatimonadota bacterium]|nr:M48 family metalloprotease [Armatimonadota bacterium]MDR7421602.1 M48 family metalloprotease [Armatimonadota bacterium]MDR7455375.1 M48 family metalloprotease [Armatimonadota bacterium]MDR7456012.1 M48 family metalloprotease [Armatimonadota bacterium]MDR7495951.1 M48 family metalloprotease [Armatimonadota bacterium]